MATAKKTSEHVYLIRSASVSTKGAKFKNFPLNPLSFQPNTSKQMDR